MTNKMEAADKRSEPPTSKPTRAPTPATPKTRPAARRPSRRSVPVNRAMMAPAMGTAATRRPARELLIFFSALNRKNQGTASSTSAKATSAFQRASSGARAPRLTANGASSSAPPAVLTKTRNAGVTSRMETLMSRYGRPQRTPTVTNNAQPRRVIEQVPAAFPQIRLPTGSPTGDKTAGVAGLAGARGGHLGELASGRALRRPASVRARRPTADAQRAGCLGGEAGARAEPGE